MDKMHHTIGILSSILFVTASIFVVINSSDSWNSRTELESSECMPCSTGGEDICHAGCLTSLGIRSRLSTLKSLQQSLSSPSSKQSSSPKPAERRTAQDAKLSVTQAKQNILNENANLLRLSTESHQRGLSNVLNSVEKNLLRAEAAEVRLRRQARLAGRGNTILEAFKSLSPEDQHVFRLRAREYELALHQAERSIVTSENAVDNIANARLPGDPSSSRPRARTQSMADLPASMKAHHTSESGPSWTTQMSQVIGNLVKDGSGAAWGYTRPVVTKKAKLVKVLPGVLTDNWTLDKGALAGRPLGDFSKLPGVKAFGW